MDDATAKAKFDEAVNLFSERRYPHALVLLKELAATFPGNNAILTAKARCLEAMGLAPDGSVPRPPSAISGDPSSHSLRQEAPRADQAPPPEGGVVIYPPPFTRRSRALVRGQERPVAIDAAHHTVEEPQRGATAYRTEPLLQGGALVVAAVGGFVLMPMAAFALFVVDAQTKGDAFPGSLIGLGLLVATPVVSVALLGKSFVPMSRAFCGFKRNTPCATVKTFIDALKHGLYRRAYNCLTDTAQEQAEVTLPRTDYLQQRMPTVAFHSLWTFLKYWRDVPFELRFDPEEKWCPPPWVKVSSESQFLSLRPGPSGKLTIVKKSAR